MEGIFNLSCQNHVKSLFSENSSDQGKEKSPKIRAFLGSGDLTRTDDTPGMKQRKALFQEARNTGENHEKSPKYRNIFTSPISKYFIAFSADFIIYHVKIMSNHVRQKRCFPGMVFHALLS